MTDPIQHLRDAAAVLDSISARIRDQYGLHSSSTAGWKTWQHPDYRAAMKKAQTAFDATPAHYQQAYRAILEEDDWDGTQVALVDAAAQLAR